MRKPLPGLPAVHDQLVAHLTADLQPVRPVWSPAARLTAWLALAAATVVLAALVGLRADLRIQLHRPRYLLETVTLVAAAAAAATGALRLAVPGRGGAHIAVRLALVLTALAAALPFAASATGTPSVHFVRDGMRCVACLALFGALPLAALLATVARSAPVDGLAAATYAGAAAIRVACPIDRPVHLLVWHMLPIAGWTILVAVASARWTERWHHTASPGLSH
jgi:hypothetical protein